MLTFLARTKNDAKISGNGWKRVILIFTIVFLEDSHHNTYRQSDPIQIAVARMGAAVP
jgi:hypothetical protein